MAIIISHTAIINKQEKFITLLFATKKYSGNIKLNTKDHEDFAWLSKKEIGKIKTVKYLNLIRELIK